MGIIGGLVGEHVAWREKAIALWWRKDSIGLTDHKLQ